MVRPLFLIAWAIGLSQPSMPKSQLHRYAATVQREAKKHHFDPFTMVALVHFESGWRASAVSRDGEDFGLAQIRARYLKPCRSEPDPVRSPSGACKAAQISLLNGSANLKRAAYLIEANRKFCRKKTGRPALFHRWLASYGGANRPSTGVFCGQKKSRKGWRDVKVRGVFSRVIKRRRWLVRKSKEIRR